MSETPHYIPGHGPIFRPWPKIARLNRDIIITEKLDGTNAAINIYPETQNICGEDVPTGGLCVSAQSRTRIITPGKNTDNMGFAQWVEDNAEALKFLGPGLHFGEWWGQGIQRNYGLKHRIFSLFNTTRWNSPEGAEIIATIRSIGVKIDVVPVLYEGPYQWTEGTPAEWAITLLRTEGSKAVPGFMNPEGIVVYHTAAKMSFKVTCEKDEQWKGQTDVAVA